MEANRGNLHLYNKSLRNFANKNRNSATWAEIHLWKNLLRASKFRDYPFRRQRPVLNYIADFMCFPLKLIVEVDGRSHDDPKVKQNDEVRQRILEEAGFTVLRFTDDEVLTDLDSVAEKLGLWINGFESRWNHSPGPRKRGRRRRRSREFPRLRGLGGGRGPLH